MAPTLRLQRQGSEFTRGCICARIALIVDRHTAFKLKAKKNSYIAPIASLDSEALGGIQTRAF